MYYSGFGINTVLCKEAGASAKKPVADREYIVRTKSEAPLDKIRKKYSESNNINDNKQDFLEENNMISLELSRTEIQELSVDDNIEFIEEDAIVEGSTQNNKIILNEKKPHKKQEKVNKKNRSDHEWNVQMINANKIKKNLVRTTGFLGTEMVSSGTSLAAPQVAAVASLIWERDPSVPADFVRDLLKESANLYGEAESYGNGLVDAEYALDHYDEFKRNINSRGKSEQDLRIEENKEKITTFEDTGCVEGCWYQDDHEVMVPSNYFNVRYGARFPDTNRYGDYEHRIFARMSLNPWWHGYYDTNYIKAVLYATRMGDAIYTHGLGQEGKAYTLKYGSASEMRSDISKINWNTELGRINKTYGKSQKDTKGFRRAFLWGMAIHSATDIFAHSVYVNGKRITHENDDADKVKYIEERYKDANVIAKQMMNKYVAKYELDVNDLILSHNVTAYRIRNLYVNVLSVSNGDVASRVASYSYTYSSSSK